MCAQERRPLSYALRLPDELQSPAAKLLGCSLPCEQQVVDGLWLRLDEIGQINGKHIWKALESWLPRPENIPSRPWRCMLEGAGRTLRAQSDRKRIFDLLLPLLQEERLQEGNSNWVPLVYRLRDELRDSREKIGYLLNVVEQTASFYVKNEKLPADYYEMQNTPVLKRPQLPLAADDGAVRGQAYRMSVADGQVTLRLKYPDDDGEWRWTPDTTFPLPEVIDPTVLLAPTLRLKRIKGGKTIAVMDFVVADGSPQQEPTGNNVLSFDWGVRRLLSFVTLNRAGEQLTPPFFVDVGGLAGKLTRLRQQISALNAKKSRLKKKKDRAQVQAEIDACWRKYRAINEALAHFASNLLIVYALLFDCDLIAGEWLKTLKVRKRHRRRGRQQRTLNWKVNTTIREAIWAKLKYKVKRFAIKTKRVWPRGSSHECPRCGKTGVTCKSPEHHSVVSPYGHWFSCTNPECGYNADRDYVASLNIGRRALAKDYPSDEKDKVECQPVSYTGTGAALPFPSPDALRKMVRCASTAGNNVVRLPQGGQIRLSYLLQLGTTLTGFHKTIAVKPQWLPGHG